MPMSFIASLSRSNSVANTSQPKPLDRKLSKKEKIKIDKTKLGSVQSAPASRLKLPRTASLESPFNLVQLSKIDRKGIETNRRLLKEVSQDDIDLRIEALSLVKSRDGISELNKQLLNVLLARFQEIKLKLQDINAQSDSYNGRVHMSSFKKAFGKMDYFLNKIDRDTHADISGVLDFSYEQGVGDSNVNNLIDHFVRWNNTA